MMCMLLQSLSHAPPKRTLAGALVLQQLEPGRAAAHEGAQRVLAEVVAAAVVDQAFVAVWRGEAENVHDCI